MSSTPEGLAETNRPAAQTDTAPESSIPCPSGVGPSRRADVGAWLRLLPRRSVIFLIELYRTWISPMRLPTCRFEPTCSAYAVEAFSLHGFFHGGALAVIRLLKCGPWHKPGYDPVPEHGFRHRPPSPDESQELSAPDDEAERPNRIADDGVGVSKEARGC